MNLLLLQSLIVGSGGCLGSMIRFWCSRLQKVYLPEVYFPYATCGVNACGSVLLGYLATVIADRSSTMYLMFGVGFCGGFTTFSTFSLEVIEAVQKQRWGIACSYIFCSLFFGLVGVYLGQNLGQKPTT